MPVLYVKFDFCWAVWFRDGLQPDGKWHCWDATSSRTRSESINTAIDGGFGAIRDRREWRRLRDRGVVRCARTYLSAHLPEVDDA